jgi:hypothetical protein
MRQEAGEEDFVALLARLRHRLCSEHDFDWLNSRIVGSPNTPSISSPEWQNALFITQRHALRREVNRRRVLQFATATRQTPYLVPCVYSGSKGAPTAEQVALLRDRSPSLHGGVDSAVYLVVGECSVALLFASSFRILLSSSDGLFEFLTCRPTSGMPVVLYANKSTPQGITNGSLGRVLGFRLHPSDVSNSPRVEGGFHVLTRPPPVVYVEMTSPHKHLGRYRGLPRHVVPIFPQSVSIQLKQEETREEQEERLHQNALEREAASIRAAFPNDAGVAADFATSRKRKARPRPLSFTTFQLPFTPAFAITDYKSQGVSADKVRFRGFLSHRAFFDSRADRLRFRFRLKVIVDLATPRNGKTSRATSYVQISRARKASGLLVLSSFNKRVIRGGMPAAWKTSEAEHARKEIVTVARLRKVSSFDSFSIYLLLCWLTVGFLLFAVHGRSRVSGRLRSLRSREGGREGTSRVLFSTGVCCRRGR